ncbi:hypothetical protein GQ55_1G173300 [Panicum hallii var. hallii]|uniref:Uncharacterized protein n=1 Tax=Panicum hallii var. hallii TaxID=1504633 RepID=A0A2T7F5X1_9POAL|nr:hypothetical protein GQ55_1G173300 [Panicum hallii var. hallii]
MTVPTMVKTWAVLIHIFAYYEKQTKFIGKLLGYTDSPRNQCSSTISGFSTFYNLTDQSFRGFQVQLWPP